MATFETYMKKPNVKDFTFQNSLNLFYEPVLAVYRNSDKKHIASLGKKHYEQMDIDGYNRHDRQSMLDFLYNHKYL